MKTILVAEDDEMMRNALVEHLKNEGFKVLPGIDGDQAFKLAVDYHPDLILLDILMPKSNGIEVLAALRKDAWGKTAKVFAFTNMSSQETIAKAKELGVDDYFVKSDTSLQMLVDSIHRKLK